MLNLSRENALFEWQTENLDRLLSWERGLPCATDNMVNDLPHRGLPLAYEILS